MIVEQIWTANAYRNLTTLIACPESGGALAADPLDHRKCLAPAKERGRLAGEGFDQGARRDRKVLRTTASAAATS